MKLDDYLEKKNMTAKEFARISGLSDSHLSMIRSGAMKPSRDAIIAIHKATKGKVTFKDLVDLDEPQTSAVA